MKMVFSFGEMYKRHSDRLNLLSDDRRENIPKLIDHFTETFQDLQLKIVSLIVIEQISTLNKISSSSSSGILQGGNFSPICEDMHRYLKKKKII